MFFNLAEAIRGPQIGCRKCSVLHFKDITDGQVYKSFTSLPTVTGSSANMAAYDLVVFGFKCALASYASYVRDDTRTANASLTRQVAGRCRVQHLPPPSTQVPGPVPGQVYQRICRLSLHASPASPDYAERSEQVWCVIPVSVPHQLD